MNTTFFKKNTFFEGVKDMKETKHKVIVEINDIMVTLELTQERLSDLLKGDSVHLISVNAEKPTYRRKRRK